MISQPVGFESPDLNIMCTITSIYLVMRMKFISFIVLECGRILYGGVRPKVASGQKYFSGIDVTNSSVVLEAIVSPLSCTQLVAKCDHIRSVTSKPLDHLQLLA